MKTERLYYDQTYLCDFDATVTSVISDDFGYWWITLDRTAFYPTSGGQPFDTGRIDNAFVSDVIVNENGEVMHRTNRQFTVGEHVRGIIDWERRFDHMQQHGGEHMLAGAIYELTGGTTIGLHLGNETSSIDVLMPDGRTRISTYEIRMTEELVNRRIQHDDRIRCWFPSGDELHCLQLRKEPTVRENIRIVQIGDYETVACGGTHPSSTGQIGSLYIIGVTPVRGKARFTFVCGGRAVNMCRRLMTSTEKACHLLSSTASEYPSEIERILNIHEKDKTDLFEIQKELLKCRLNSTEQEPVGNSSMAVVYEPKCDAAPALPVISEWIREPGRIVLFSDGKKLIYAASDDVPEDMAFLIKSTAKGGGKKGMAAGAGGKNELLTAKSRLINS